MSGFFDGIDFSIRANFKTKHGEEPKSLNEMHLAFVKDAACAIAGPYISDEFDLVANITEGPGDTGLDAIAIVIDRKLVTTSKELREAFAHSIKPDCKLFLIQVTISQRNREAKLNTFIEGALDFISAEPTQKPQHSGITAHRKLKTELVELCLEKQLPPPTVLLHFACLGRDAPVDERMSAATAQIDASGERAFYAGINLEIFDAQSTFAKIDQYDRRRKTLLDATNMMYAGNLDGHCPTFIGFVTVDDIIKLITEEDASGALHLDTPIFAENVRNDLGENNPIQQGIQNTLQSEQSVYLPVFHNGITIVCNHCVRDDDQKHLIMHDYQIVDGCQTSMAILRSLEKLYDKTANIKLTITAATDRKLRNQIVLATNSQANVTNEQMLSLMPANRDIQRFFSMMRAIGPNLLYDVRQGQSENDSPTIDDFETSTDADAPSRIRAYDLYKSYASMYRATPERATKGIESVRTKMLEDLSSETPHGVYPYYVAGLARHWLKIAVADGTIPETHKDLHFHYLHALACMHRSSADKPMLDDREHIANKLADALETPEQRTALFTHLRQTLDDTIASDEQWKHGDKKTPRNENFTKAVVAQLG